MRIDRLLCRLRFFKSRARAQAVVESGHVRCNGRRVGRASLAVGCGDVLTFPLGRSVRVIELTALPGRRGPPAEARACYRELDPDGQSAIAAHGPGVRAPARKGSDPK
ncbi:RNA-binding S4 domain-containing protein [Pelagerythrobacter marinus]|uniref:RNA-binding S4 domain-containing protein n=1 Tax=Pelagerythrobacter marinus TaxID=538382 RepID=UPI0020373ED4|nr:S4 domain-containing protein [Pelagerythrobacter marinus]USA39159.1 S4 domain-containing protein [Pelagerythrobacter marinus]WPZ06754.1 S4 domain-containing protein [Pelagerythrobacter marinus]